METEFRDILGRRYKYINQHQTEQLYSLRVDLINGHIDANECEHKSYKIIFEFENIHTTEFEGVASRLSHNFESGSFWVANHNKQTLTFDGLRSMRHADVLKEIGGENPPLISKREYDEFIEFYSKFYGIYLPKKNVTKEEITKLEFEYAQEIVKLFREQELERRRSRKPILGEIVITLDGSIGRYIGNGQAIYKEENNSQTFKRDLVDKDVDWPKEVDGIPTEKDVLEYINKNKWIKFD